MPRNFIPDFSFADITHIGPAFLKSNNIGFLMFDLDNTVASYGESVPAQEIATWARAVEGAGIALFIVSNSTRKTRADKFAAALGVGFAKGASKPSPDCILQVMSRAGFGPGESAFAGDQIFTDTLAANRAGVMSIIVRPRGLKNPLLAARYFLEAPFRALCRNKMAKPMAKPERIA